MLFRQHTFILLQFFEMTRKMSQAATQPTLPDIVPYDTVTTGVNQEGIFGAARGIIQNSVFTLLLFAALIVLLNIFFPCSTYGSSAAKGSDCFVETFVVDRSTCRIAAVVCSMVSIDTYMPSGFNGIDVGAEEQKFPTIPVSPVYCQAQPHPCQQCKTPEGDNRRGSDG